MPKLYAMVGGAGYVAPKHMAAIRDTGGQLSIVYDPNNSIGIIDKYFRNCYVFNDWWKFDKAIREIPIDYFVICSPNNYHRYHIEYGLSVADNVICEKPLVIDPADLTYLEELMDVSYTYPYQKKNIYPILQLRDIKPGKMMGRDHKVEVTYHTPRGFWYSQSWKFNPAESGGLLMNIGIHLFDFLIYKFGKVLRYEVDYLNGFHAAGYLELVKAKVKWNLSIDPDLKPYRAFKVNDKVWEFDPGIFDTAHSLVYKKILAGKGHDFLSTRDSINLVHAMNDLHKDKLWNDFNHMQTVGWKI